MKSKHTIRWKKPILDPDTGFTREIQIMEGDVMLEIDTDALARILGRKAAGMIKAVVVREMVVSSEPVAPRKPTCPITVLGITVPD